MNIMPTAEAVCWQRIETLFDEVNELEPAACEARLDAAEAEIAAEVRSLLTAARSSDSLFALPPELKVPLSAPSASVAGGTRISAWRVVGLIGRGGMGEVYRAERADGQFRQQVALKLSATGAAVRGEQFNNERQILATLEHPGIARLVDGGLGEDGRPYMVMELVEGQELMGYCRDHALGLEQRLELFGQVCEAVGYAHRHLVVHRDLKPNNILVTAEGRVKLLDFGIAKLLQPGQAESTATLALMTPEYAAPEQLEGRPVTTATDIYALGVLLYQLLAGVPPWSFGNLPLPATLQRLLDSRPRPLAEAAAENPQAPLPPRLLRGDLDAITAKALRSEPEQRYASTSGLWADVQRHLTHQPVQARRGTRSYLLRRFLRRNRLWVGATAAVMLSLVAGLAGTAWQAHRVTVERDNVLQEIARTQAILDYFELMFRTAGDQPDGKTVSAKDVLDRSVAELDHSFADKPADHARIMAFVGEMYGHLKDYEGSAPLLSHFLETADLNADPASTAQVRLFLAQAELRRGNLKPAAEQIELAQAFWLKDPQHYQAKLIRSRVVQGQVQRAMGQVDQAIATYRESLPQAVAVLGQNQEDTVNIENSLSLTLMQTGQLDEAKALMEKVWQSKVALGRENHDDGIIALQNRGAIAMYRGELPQAEEYLRKAIALRKQLLGPSDAMAAAENNLGKVLIREGRPAEALPFLDEAAPIATAASGDHGPLPVGIMQSTAEARIALKDVKDAEPLMRQVLQLTREHFGEKHPLYAASLALQARLDLLKQDPAGAAQSLQQAVAILGQLGGTGKLQLGLLQNLQEEVAAAQR